MHSKGESQIEDTVLATNIPGGPKSILSLGDSTRSINRGENNNNNDKKNNKKIIKISSLVEEKLSLQSWNL